MIIIHTEPSDVLLLYYYNAHHILCVWGIHMADSDSELCSVFFNSLTEVRNYYQQYGCIIHDDGED